MKHILTCSLLLLIIINSQALAASEEMMSIQVKQGQLRSLPSYLGKVTATVDYGTRLQVAEKQGEWIKLSSADGKTSGWIHSSALTKKQIKLAAGDKNAETAASSGELALAGKGFNSDVEAEFKTKNKDIDFTWVDKMAKIKVPQNEMEEFLKKGGVKPAEGGAR